MSSTATEMDGYAIIRAVRVDDALSAPQRSLLVFAVARADTRGKDAGRVRASLELIAKDAGLSSKSPQRAFKDPAVLRYFAKVERRTRSVGLWFHLTTPDRESGVKQVAEQATSKTAPDSSARNAVTNNRVTPSPTPDSVSTTPDTVSTTPDTESDHLPTPTSTPTKNNYAATAFASADTNGWPPSSVILAGQRLGLSEERTKELAQDHPATGEATGSALTKLLSDHRQRQPA